MVGGVGQVRKGISGRGDFCGPSMEIREERRVKAFLYPDVVSHLHACVRPV